MKFIFRLFATSLLTLTVSLVCGGVAVWGNPQPWKLSYVYRFKTENGGRYPTSALIADAQGALYGATTFGGGESDKGTIYKLTPSGNGYEYHVIHAFHSGDGQFPKGPLIVDKTGAIFGTTFYGGLHSTPGDPGFGLVFKLTPSPHGYIESFLHFFNGGDGRNPNGGLVMDATGSLYGVTAHGGGAGSDGTAYKLTPTPTGYAETLLYRFALDREGHRPFGELLLDRFGSLYGVTNGFSVNGLIRGTVYKLTPEGNGYSERTLYGFIDSTRGATPGGGLIIDASGALYGTTSYGGANNVGAVYKLTPTRNGYAETVIFSFSKTGTSGELPFCTLMMDASGAIYGTASEGGSDACSYPGCGTVFKLTPSRSHYIESTVFLFSPPGYFSDGYSPESGVIEDVSGAIYATAEFGGGGFASGTIIKLTR